MGWMYNVAQACLWGCQPHDARCHWGQTSIVEGGLKLRADRSSWQMEVRWQMGVCPMQNSLVHQKHHQKHVFDSYLKFPDKCQSWLSKIISTNILLVLQIFLRISARHFKWNKLFFNFLALTRNSYSRYNLKGNLETTCDGYITTSSIHSLCNIHCLLRWFNGSR